MKKLSDMKILLTGGVGYIGSHVCVELLNMGCKVVIIDNLSNSCIISLDRVAKITKNYLSGYSAGSKNLIFYEGDIRDEDILNHVFKHNKFDAVLHLAGLKAVGESLIKPLEYYSNNVVGSIKLFQKMGEFGVRNLIFSSSATVYGVPNTLPITEKFTTGDTTNPYGQSKYIVEQILKDLSQSELNWKICLLRYFNPVGAHPSGLIGENPNGFPNNLLPIISKVALGQLDKVQIFGNDYPTTDGTGVRDYIHVVDLARGHVAALKYLTSVSGGCCEALNLGTGKGKSVLEVLRAYEAASGKSVPYEFVEKRVGDVSEIWAATSYANATLNWSARLNLQKICADDWNWQIKNPHGYDK